MKIRCLTSLTVFLSLCFVSPAAQAENPEHVERLLETRACFNCDLRGADLRGEHLIGADLRLSDLSGEALVSVKGHQGFLLGNYE